MKSHFLLLFSQKNFNYFSVILCFAIMPQFCLSLGNFVYYVRDRNFQFNFTKKKMFQDLLTNFKK